MPRFAANLSMMFNEVPFLERFGAAAEAGFEAVEFLFPYEHTPEAVAERLRAGRLQNALFNMPPGDWQKGERGIAALPGREREFREGVVTALRYARALGTPTLHAMCGLVPPGTAPAVCRKVYVENLRYAARELARDGRTLVIEPINGRDMPGYFLQAQGEAHAIREEVGEPNLKVQMDLYHAQIVEGDLSVKLRRFIGQVGHVQIASVPDRHEPDGGELSYPYLFRLLDELGYPGFVGCEYRPARGTVEGLGWFAPYRRKG
ncbi:MAG: hydroxypyruvate isomerase family protein [Deltaproteobacteria bacterium]|nr:hydroxypyruvate isomerase family protein [Deltaproteobacteria bacterium]